ncbi:MAG: Zn-dependent alcohol dehydrogenase [Armatimonadetes bacterium]|nr:Zn-dependent alcohol dehydrogenase [Armatimonadota bacterium]MDW8154681.1 Zn-dependent alcohol dehydrogenase [Armatimonadota bacterium]
MKAAVLQEPKKPLMIQDIEVDAPGPREVVVRTVAAGVCHSDLHIADGDLPAPLPMVLGHEAAGVVEKVGSLVTRVRPGDHVVVCVTAFCGQCKECLTGHLNLCRSPYTKRDPSEPPRLRRDGQAVNQFANIGAFAEQMLIHENAVVKIPDDVPFEAAALLSCGVLTGVGAVFNTAKVQPGSTVAVFGLGGVGISVVQGAHLAGARRIIAVDILPQKLEIARRFGATDVVNASEVDPVEAILKLTGEGVDYSFAVVGSPKVYRQCVDCLAPLGTATIIGVPSMTDTLELEPRQILRERRLQGSVMGSNRFPVDIPRYLELYRQGRLKLDEMVSRKAGLESVNESFEWMRRGEVIRTVLTFS